MGLPIQSLIRTTYLGTRHSMSTASTRRQSNRPSGAGADEV